MSVVYATITIELSKAGLHCICEDIDEDVFCIDGKLDALVELINKAEDLCNPETVFMLTDKGKEEAEKLKGGNYED